MDELVCNYEASFLNLWKKYLSVIETVYCKNDKLVQGVCISIERFQGFVARKTVLYFAFYRYDKLSCI